MLSTNYLADYIISSFKSPKVSLFVHCIVVYCIIRDNNNIIRHLYKNSFFQFFQLMDYVFEM